MENATISTPSEQAREFVKSRIASAKGWPITDINLNEISKIVGIDALLKNGYVSVAETRLAWFVDKNKEFFKLTNTTRTKINNFIRSSMDMYTGYLDTPDANFVALEHKQMRDKLTVVFKGIQVKYASMPDTEDTLHKLQDEVIEFELELYYKCCGAYTEACVSANQLSEKRQAGLVSAVDHIAYLLGKADRHWYGSYLHRDNYIEELTKFMQAHSELPVLCIERAVSEWVIIADKALTPYIHGEKFKHRFYVK